MSRGDGPHSSALALLSLVSLVVQFPIEQPQPHLSHLSSQLLNQIYSPRDTLPKSWREWRKVMSSREPGVGEKCEVEFDQVERTCIDILRGGTDAITDWIHHDLEPLVSTDDDDPSTLSQTKMLRTSPFGLFVRRSILSIDKLGFEEMREWYEGMREWFGIVERGGNLRRSNRSKQPNGPESLRRPPLSNPRTLLLTSLSYFHTKDYNLLLISLAETFKISRSFGDKETLFGCWSLLKRLPKRYQTQFLNDLGQSSLGSDRDSTKKGKSKEQTSPALSNPHDLLYEVYASLLSRDDKGQLDPISIPSLFSKLYTAKSLSTSISSPPPPTTSLSHPNNTNNNNNKPSTSAAASSTTTIIDRVKYEVDQETFEKEYWFVMQEVWERIGIEPISRIYQDLVLSNDDEDLRSDSSSPTHLVNTRNSRRRGGRVKEDLRLRVLLERVRKLSLTEDRTDPHQALKLLLSSIETGEKRSSIGLWSSSTDNDEEESSIGPSDGLPKWKRRVLEVIEVELSKNSEKGPRNRDGLETIQSLLSSRAQSQDQPDRISPSTRLSSSLLSQSTSSSSSTISSISHTLDLTLSRLELTSCTSREEALRGLIELERLEGKVLIFSSSASSSSSSTRAEEEETVDREGKDEVQEEWGDMNGAKEVEAKYWATLGRMRIVANDFDDETIKANLRLLEKSFSIYDSLYLSTEAEKVSTLIESLCEHLSLSDQVSVGEQSEWKRRGERQRARRTGHEGERDTDLDWKKMLEVVDLVQELLE